MMERVELGEDGEMVGYFLFLWWCENYGVSSAASDNILNRGRKVGGDPMRDRHVERWLE